MTGAEDQHHEAAADPEDVVDTLNIELSFCVGGIADLQMGQEIQQDGLRHQRVRAGNEGLRCNDSRHGTQYHSHRTEHPRQHLEEGVQVGNVLQGGIVHIGNDPCALPQVVEDEAALDERPAAVDILTAHMTHIGIEGFCTGSG